jgi:hypothetical protein
MRAHGALHVAVTRARAARAQPTASPASDATRNARSARAARGRGGGPIDRDRRWWASAGGEARRAAVRRVF